METLLRETQVAEMINVQRQTVQKWRLLGEGPKFIKCRGAIRYRLEDVEDYLKKCEKRSTKD